MAPTKRTNRLAPHTHLYHLFNPHLHSIFSFPLFALALQNLLVHVAAWGPYTHEYFGRLYLNETSSPSSHFLSGCAAPDTFKYISHTLHTLEFSAVLYLHAASVYASILSPDPSSISDNENSDLVEFALGYGCHIVSDLVGHHNHGYLNPKYDHSIEIATDAYLYHHHHLQQKPQKNHLRHHSRGDSSSHYSFPNQLTYKEADYISNVTMVADQYYNTSTTTTIPKVNQKEARDAVTNFIHLETTERGMLPFMDHPYMYRHIMTKDSSCVGNKIKRPEEGEEKKEEVFATTRTFEEVEQDFQLASQWAKQMCTHWTHEMLELNKNISEIITMQGDNGKKLMHRSVASAVGSTYNLLEHLFEKNGGSGCAPSSVHLFSSAMG